MAFSAVFKNLTPTFIYLLITATIGPLLFGFHLAELNAPQEVITCVKKGRGTSSAIRDGLESRSIGLPQCIPMDALQFGMVTSFFTLGGLAGALLAGPMTAKRGRLPTMALTATFAVTGPTFEALAPSFGALAVGRFLSGVGAGAATVVAPIYISEIAPPSQKGFFGSFTQVMINLGILITQVMGLFLSRGQLWRIILATGGVIAIAQIAGLVIGGQESPKWLVDNGKPAEARRILQKLRGHRVDISAETTGWGLQNEHNIEEEQENLLADERSSQTLPPNDNRPSGSRSESRTALGPFAVLVHPDYWPAVFAVTTIMVAQQLTGINSIVMYGVALLSDLLAANSAMLNVIVALVNIVVTVAGAPLVDRLGRKTCLLMSMGGMGASSLVLGFGIMNSIPILSAVAVLFFVAAFGLGLGPVPFILASELVNSEAVGATQSWALAANWTATFFVAQFFPIVNEKLGKGQVYFVFAGFAALFGAFTAWWVPETKGKADADEVWGRKKPQDLED
ncbi:general substrate transporter [Dissoconium aciculare CBS 342.82]|uniref:General substrate transporter n=1 Tax=Dissoconium aciculare CBS 342.82 TaxID=1314786 RepID=A0A6J3LZK3_9PEZI|nr:general substrate transporter [Dissoconium aciculare CBS 342.82]KAF1821083.1 general substrate transporter [Dissoconium aciculare CBS 342.82]